MLACAWVLVAVCAAGPLLRGEGIGLRPIGVAASAAVLSAVMVRDASHRRS